MITRRLFCSSLIAAPVIVKASSLMTLSGYKLKEALTLEHHNFCLSWWEKVGTGQWRQGMERFSAAHAPPIVEVHPTVGATQVACVTIDSHGTPDAIYKPDPDGVAVYKTAYDGRLRRWRVPYTHTFRVSEPVIRSSCHSVIDFTGAEEAELMARNEQDISPWGDLSPEEVDKINRSFEAARSA